LIRHLIHVARAALRERRKRSQRSPQWRHVERQHLLEHPACAACGGTVRMQVHHVQPFAERPELELDPSNLIGLCMGADECHLRLGHGGDFHHFNPEIRSLAARFYVHKAQRPALVEEARRLRLPIGGVDARAAFGA
jgi:hypothetical protein